MFRILATIIAVLILAAFTITISQSNEQGSYTFPPGYYWYKTLHNSLIFIKNPAPDTVYFEEDSPRTDGWDGAYVHYREFQIIDNDGDSQNNESNWKKVHVQIGGTDAKSVGGLKNKGDEQALLKKLFQKIKKDLKKDLRDDDVNNDIVAFYLAEEKDGKLHFPDHYETEYWDLADIQAEIDKR